MHVAVVYKKKQDRTTELTNQHILSDYGIGYV